MANRVIRGDVGEALFRLLAEKNLSPENTRLEQWGYNPDGVIEPLERGADPALWSGPDFALVPADAPADIRQASPWVGISINTQALPYTVHSSREAGCLGCPELEPCAARERLRTWFNLLNVSNDYRRFHAEYEVDVAMITLFFEWRSSAVKWLKRPGRAEALKRYIIGGEAACDEDSETAAARSYIEFGGRAGSNRGFALRWVWWSELASGLIPFYGTFGFAQTARAPMKLCVPFDELHDEGSLWQALADVDAAGPRGRERSGRSRGGRTFRTA